MKKHTAFTLIEVITVLVIIGLLAAIALPNVFSQIERNRAQEAINTLGAIRQAMESCGASQTTSYDFTNCNTWSAIAMTDPSNSNGNSGASFNYTINNPAPVNCSGSPSSSTVCYTLVATRTINNSNTVTINRYGDGSVKCTAINAYAGFC